MSIVIIGFDIKMHEGLTTANNEKKVDFSHVTAIEIYRVKAVTESVFS